MRGQQTLKVITKRVEYNLKFRRNITIIRGDSGTGKTTLCSILHKYIVDQGRSAHKVKCSCKFRVLSDSWLDALPVLKDSENYLIFVDEDANYINSLEFADMIMGSSNYFVIITRSTIKNIPFSYKEVYEFNSVSVGNTTVVSNIPFYSDLKHTIKPDCIITEDTKSGYIMLRALCGNNTVEISEEEKKYGIGNNKLLEKCQRLAEIGHKVLVMLDGAAIGYLIESLYKEARENNNVVLWAPESFEYLLLQSGIVCRRDVPIILEKPEDQISSELFPTWERFFTWLVTDIMREYNGHTYAKGNLKPWYYNTQNLLKFEKVIPIEAKHLINKHPSDALGE